MAAGGVGRRFGVIYKPCKGLLLGIFSALGTKRMALLMAGLMYLRCAYFYFYFYFYLLAPELHPYRATLA